MGPSLTDLAAARHHEHGFTNVERIDPEEHRRLAARTLRLERENRDLRATVAELLAARAREVVDRPEAAAVIAPSGPARASCADASTQTVEDPVTVAPVAAATLVALEEEEHRVMQVPAVLPHTLFSVCLWGRRARARVCVGGGNGCMERRKLPFVCYSGALPWVWCCARHSKT